MTHPFRRAAASILTLALSLTVGVAAVRADDFGTGGANTGWLADDAVHTYCWGPGMDSDLRLAATYAMGNSIDYFTDMTDSFDAACYTTTDIKWVGADLPGTTRGQYQCLSRTGNVCHRAQVTLDKVQIDIGANDVEDRYKTACHEAGHSVGLTHGGSTDCMLNGEVPSTSATYRNFNGHHIDHINDQY
jgi:hypothetical protein